jgi:DNA-binding NtrC family response regulator
VSGDARKTTEEISPSKGHRRDKSVPSLVLALADGRVEAVSCAIPPAGLLLGRDGPPVFPQSLGQGTSRRHAEIRVERGAPTLHDLGSRNGTWVNGARIAGPRALRPGDVIRLGETLLVYARCPSPPPDTARMPGIVGNSEAMARVRESVELVAGRLSVLVTGETGTGKEVVAQALHERSGRAGRLVSVNCGALSEELLSSELFGHVRGAFTGAAADHPGLFRAAHRGTLFLDEIGEMPLDLQAQLLRAAELGRVRPVGGLEEVAVDVTIVAATNRDLVADVRAGRFRADLYARLAQWTLTLPPLRVRRDDIPLLVKHYLARNGAAGRTLSRELGEALLVDPWPLNVRGLFNVLSVALLASPKDTPLDLDPPVVSALESARALAAPAADGAQDAEAVEDALERAGGNVAEAAKHLGWSRQKLYRWIEQQGLRLDRFRRSP